MSDLDALQQRVGEWGEATFPDATNITIWNHLFEEVNELAGQIGMTDIDPGMSDEAADCLTLLLYLAHRNGFSLIAEAEKKFAVNQSRTWNTVAVGGYIKHDEVQP